MARSAELATKPRAPPRSVRAGFASPATPVSRELSYEPIHDLPVRVARRQATSPGPTPRSPPPAIPPTGFVMSLRPELRPRAQPNGQDGPSLSHRAPRMEPERPPIVECPFTSRPPARNVPRRGLDLRSGPPEEAPDDTTAPTDGPGLSRRRHSRFPSSIRLMLQWPVRSELRATWCRGGRSAAIGQPSVPHGTAG